MPSGSCLGWDIGPTVGALTLRAIPGFPVTWALGPVEGYVPADPVFEVRLSDWTVLSFPAPGGAVALTADQTAPLRHASSARLIDSGQVIAAGPFRVMKSWSADCAPVTAPVRIVVGPQGDQGNPGIDAAPPEFAVAAVPLPPHTAPTATIAGDYPDLDLEFGIPEGRGVAGVTAAADDLVVTFTDNETSRFPMPRTLSGVVIGTDGHAYLDQGGRAVVTVALDGHAYLLEAS